MSIQAFKQPMQQLEQLFLQNTKEVNELHEECISIKKKLEKDVKEKVKSNTLKLKSKSKIFLIQIR